MSVSTKEAGKKDLDEAMKALTKIHKGILNIQQQQQRDRKRLVLHSATNLLNYDHVYYGSLIETMTFIIVSLFQVRKNKQIKINNENTIGFDRFCCFFAIV